MARYNLVTQNHTYIKYSMIDSLLYHYRQAVSQLRITADDVVISDIKTTEGNQLQITILIVSSGRVVSATMVRNAIQVNSYNI